MCNISTRTHTHTSSQPKQVYILAASVDRQSYVHPQVRSSRPMATHPCGIMGVREFVLVCVTLLLCPHPKNNSRSVHLILTFGYNVRKENIQKSLYHSFLYFCLRINGFKSRGPSKTFFLSSLSQPTSQKSKKKKKIINN